jgi:hypothetical protein
VYSGIFTTFGAFVMVVAKHSDEREMFIVTDRIWLLSCIKID